MINISDLTKLVFIWEVQIILDDFPYQEEKIHQDMLSHQKACSISFLCLVMVLRFAHWMCHYAVQRLVYTIMCSKG